MATKQTPRPPGQDHFSVLCNLYEKESELLASGLAFWLKIIGKCLYTTLYLISLLTTGDRVFPYKLFLSFSALHNGSYLMLRARASYLDMKEDEHWIPSYIAAFKGCLVYPRMYLLFYASLFLAFAESGNPHLLVTSMLIFYEFYYIGELAGRNFYLNRKYKGVVDDYCVPIFLSVSTYQYGQLHLFQKKRLWSAFFLQNVAVLESVMYLGLLLRTFFGGAHIVHTLVCTQIFLSRYNLDPFPIQVYKNVRARARNLRSSIFNLISSKV